MVEVDREGSEEGQGENGTTQGVGSLGMQITDLGGHSKAQDRGDKEVGVEEVVQGGAGVEGKSAAQVFAG